MTKKFLILLLLFSMSANLSALERPDMEFKVFQFPSNMIPRIDGNTDDWDIVSDDYTIGTDQLSDTVKGIGTNINTRDIDVKVRVGWVKGLNRLYFLYEAFDEFWDFAENGRHADIFEVVVDGDLSGGPLIKSMNPNKDHVSEADLHYLFHGVHAQNYHIFTPPGNKDWNFVWGAAQYTKDLPFANHAYSYNFKHGESGKMILEFWITAFDYSPYDAPDKAVQSDFRENKLIGLSWSVLDYDGPGDNEGFYNLSHKTTMYGDASDLCAFRLMPVEKQFLKPIDAKWTYKVVDMDSRLVAFKDNSYGTITKWSWDFGDGTTSTEQSPIHQFKEAGEKIVVLTIEGPEGTAQFARVRDIVLK
ncbi:PKD domain-containing protein [Candidatus Latescibacterota bacterium]